MSGKSFSKDPSIQILGLQVTKLIQAIGLGPQAPVLEYSGLRDSVLLDAAPVRTLTSDRPASENQRPRLDLRFVKARGAWQSRVNRPIPLKP